MLLDGAAFGCNSEELQEVRFLDVEVKVKVTLVENRQSASLLFIDVYVAHVDEMALFRFNNLGVQQHLLVHLVTNTFDVQLDGTSLTLHVTQYVEVERLLFLGLESDIDHLFSVGLHSTVHRLQRDTLQIIVRLEAFAVKLELDRDVLKIFDTNLFLALARKQ